MISAKHLELLQFDRIRELVSQRCSGAAARKLCLEIDPSPEKETVLPLLYRTNELCQLLQGKAFFPSVEHDDIRSELHVISLPGAMLEEQGLLRVMKSIETANSMIRFLNDRKNDLKWVSQL